jgi:hypothetical protein
MKKQILCLLGIGVLAVWTTGCSQGRKAAAQGAASEWLKLVDSGNYAQSWDAAANLMKSSVAKEQWQQILNANRAPLGSLISRKLTSAEYKEDLPGAPSGEYVVLRYESSFQNRNAVIETAAPTLDKDGTWRVSLYYIK